MAQINLSFDGATLTGATGALEGALPATWYFGAHSPAPGDLRFLAVDLSSGDGWPFSGEVFRATFTIDINTPVGPVPVNAVVEVRDGFNKKLNLTITPGVVMVTSPGT